jgi:hypothetical protein
MATAAGPGTSSSEANQRKLLRDSRVYYESYLTQQIQKALCSQTAYLLLLELGNTITYSYSSTQPSLLPK